MSLERGGALLARGMQRWIRIMPRAQCRVRQLTAFGGGRNGCTGLKLGVSRLWQKAIKPSLRLLWLTYGLRADWPTRCDKLLAKFVSWQPKLDSCTVNRVTDVV